MFQAKQDVLAGIIMSAKGMAQDAVKKYEDALAKSPKDYNATHMLAGHNYKLGVAY